MGRKTRRERERERERDVAYNPGSYDELLGVHQVNQISSLRLARQDEAWRER
jgi:hypothetical protein